MFEARVEQARLRNFKSSCSTRSAAVYRDGVGTEHASLTRTCFRSRSDWCPTNIVDGVVKWLQAARHGLLASTPRSICLKACFETVPTTRRWN